MTCKALWLHLCRLADSQPYTYAGIKHHLKDCGVKDAIEWWNDLVNRETVSSKYHPNYYDDNLSLLVVRMIDLFSK